MVFRDVTREKAAGLERDQLNRELSEKDKRKDEFLAMLAHELRNPLAAIGNAVMLSSRSDLRDHLEWSLGVIRRQMRHLSRLIDDLLDVSRISRGKIELKCARVDAETILRHAVETVRPLIEEKQHALDVAIEPGGLWTDADPTRLEQIIVNLLNNAAKYTEKGGRIEVAAGREGDAVRIVVSDTGVGIPPEKLSDMFELFVQGDRSLARSEGGLGIGLTVVKKLVEMHGGSISARSDGPGRGSEFTIRVPAAMPIAGAVHDAPKIAPSAGGSRVLVVDDNVDTVLGLSKILTILGHQVTTAFNGPDAIEAARRTRPEFVLLDLGLPGMDGYEVARRLRSDDCCRHAVIIAITGYGHEADRNRSKESGFDHHLVKPLDHDALVTILSRS
jgi:CheY-like chemotaxis protein/nitrogen-specific signal transduction histidine kinase